MSSLPDTMQGAMLLGPEEIEIRDVPVPRPGAGEILLKVEAATTCGTDVKVFRRGGHPLRSASDGRRLPLRLYRCS